MTFGLNEIFDHAKTVGAVPAPLTSQTLGSITILPSVLKNIEHLMETKHSFDWIEFNAFGTGEEQTNDKDLHMGSQDKLNLATFIRNTPLKEFIAKSGAMSAAGLQGSNYMIPVKIYDVLQTSSVESDIVGAVSAAMLGPAELPGTTCNIDIVKDDTFHPLYYSSGGKMPESNLTIVQAVLDFSNSFGLHIPITNDLIEDQKWGLMELSLRTAGQEMGEFATNMALTILGTGTDGDGTVAAVAGTNNDITEYIDANATTTDINYATVEVTADGFDPNTMVTSHHSMLHAMINTSGNQYAESLVHDRYLSGGWPTRMGPTQVHYTNCDYITNIITGGATPFINCKTLVFDKQYALLSGRKRWLRIDNYADPICDLVGSTISSRQDSVTMYNDSICRYTEN